MGRGEKEKKNDGDVLEREIYAIGGSKEDYELLADVESDSEIEMIQVAAAGSNGTKDEEKLRKDIANMVKDINQPDDGVDDVSVDKPSEVDHVPQTRISSAKDVSKKLLKVKSTRKEKFLSKDKQVPHNPAASSLVGLLYSSEDPFC